MACPYCGSGDWEQHGGAIKFKEELNGIWAYYASECRDCGRTFVTRNWCKTDCYDYECMTEEEYQESE